MSNIRRVPELLAPAGSPESLRAALAGGADAVYFGGAMFSNRMRAKNFAGDSIRDAIRLCHSVGAAAHITVNTRVRADELDGIYDFAETILGGSKDEQADALIVADLGVARAIKTAFPDAVLHASTQTSMMSVSDCRALAELGFSRLVVPRELSFDEIKSLVALSPIEIEMFIHGAHCVSCSGQCLMSYVMGGRSGNRGECAQPCRLSYKMQSDGAPSTIGGSYPLSMADMYLGAHIPEIISSGVASLKIEGRLKSPSYVYGVTKIYRRLLDENRAATAAEKRALEDLFTRGFTDGYFTSHYKSMGGLKSTEKPVNDIPLAKEISSALTKRQSAEREKKAAVKPEGEPLKARFTLKRSSPAEFELIYGHFVGRGTGAVPAESTGNPITAESAAKNLTKLGESGFVLSAEDIDFSIDNGLWMPLSALNELRRQALADLSSKIPKTTKEDNKSSAKSSVTPLPVIDKSGRKTVYTAEIANLTLFMSGEDEEDRFESFAENFARIYVPLDDVAHALKIAKSEDTKEKICAVLPVFSSDENRIKDILERTSAGRAMCHTAGQVRLVRSLGLVADISFRGNILNPLAASVYESLGCTSVMLSPEASLHTVREISSSVGCDVSLIGYGRLPVMHLSRCIISGGQCRKGNTGGRMGGRSPKPHICTGSLTDRIGEVFPVISSSDCTNVIFNSTPIWMGDRKNELTLGGYTAEIHFMFTTESPEEAILAARGYSDGEHRAGRRIQQR